MIKKWFPVLSLTILFVSFPGLLWAQGLYSYSYLSYNESTGYVSGYSALSVNYDVYLYYNVEVNAKLINEETGSTVDTNYNTVTMGNYSWVEAPVSALADFGVPYKVEGRYFADCYYQGATGMWFDYYNYSFWPPQGIYAWNWFNFSSGGTVEIWYSSMTVGYTYDTVNTSIPTLTFSSTNLIRGNTATFTLNHVATIDTIHWRYWIPANDVLTGGEMIERSGSANTPWSGVIVSSGILQVDVLRSTKPSLSLSQAITVEPRSWTSTTPLPQKVANGGQGMQVLNNPPTNPTDPLGMYNFNILYDYEWNIVNDNGPNHGLKYVTCYVLMDAFFYEISPALEDESCEFFKKQYGRCGIISGSLLREDTEFHESGSVSGSHYYQFKTAYEDPAYNMPRIESFIGAINDSTYYFRLQGILDNRELQITSATTIEPCAGEVRGPYCRFDGTTNYPPYQTCP